MSKEELNQNLLQALDNFEHQSYQVAKDEASLELAATVYRLMNAFRENLINYLQ